jgi:hypothetical protein
MTEASRLVAVEALSERTAEDLSLVEIELLRLLEGNKQLSRRLSRLDEKVSGLVIEYRRTIDDVTTTLTSNTAMLERILEKLRGPQ